MDFYHQKDQYGEYYYLFHSFFIEGIYYTKDHPIICRKNTLEADTMVSLRGKYIAVTQQVYEEKLIEAIDNPDTEIIIL